jgi:hypothetical protein
MPSTIPLLSEHIKTALINLSPEDQRFFSETKENYTKREMADSPLLDQLCWVLLIEIRLKENFSKVLSTYTERLKSRIDMPDGWRKSTTIKSYSELESPMPWLHPFKLAADDIQSLEEELVSAVSARETAEKDLKILQEIFDQYNLQFPLQPISLKPEYLPRPTRIFK